MNIFNYVYVLSVWVCALMWVPMEASGFGSPRAGHRWCEPSSVWWVPNSGPLQEQYVFLATGLSLQPWTLTFCCLMLSNVSIPHTFEEYLCLLNLGFCVKSMLKPNLKFYLYSMLDFYIYEFMFIHDFPPASQLFWDNLLSLFLLSFCFKIFLASFKCLFS